MNFILVTSPAKEFTSWDDMDLHQQGLCEHSDAYKTENGFRPRGAWVAEMTAGQLLRETARCYRRSNEQFERHEAAEAAEASRMERVEREARTRQEWTLGDFWTQAVAK